MKHRLLFFAGWLFFFSCGQPQQETSNATVSTVMDDVISRLYRQVPPEQYDSIEDGFIFD